MFKNKTMISFEKEINIKDEMIDVSIVIVCMNNLINLYPCLESIRKYTKEVEYETLVVAYLFTKDNLEKVKADFPWVTFIESNEIRGFSENNNLALKQAKGKYCFVLNDDTYIADNAIGKLVETHNGLSEDIAVLCPTTKRPDGSVQHCGVAKFNMFTYILWCMGLLNYYVNHSRYVNKKGLFQTYNVHGACFLIRKSIFEDVNWFDERFFFCPEDIALSTKINNEGYKCFVDSNINIYHTGGGTWSNTIIATKPATAKGEYIFYGTNIINKILFLIISTLRYGGCMLYWLIKMGVSFDEHKRVMFTANKNAIFALYSHLSPKELFVKFYKK